MKLATLSILTLTAMYNAMSDVPVKKFKDKPTAVARVQAAAKSASITLSDRFNDDGSDKPVAPPAPKKKKDIKGAKGPATKGPVIRIIAEALLLKVVGKDPDGRNLGMRYDDVLAAVLKQFPEANTTVACLRWYAVHMRERGEKVPNRPRVLPPKA